MNVKQIRDEFAQKLKLEHFTVDKTGVKTVEIIGAQFIVDEDKIFGELNLEYIKDEIDWYFSESLNVNDLKNTPKIWKQVADPDGFINSNYGWCITHPDNFDQYQSCFNELVRNPDSRRAIMIYTRPAMQYDYNKNGRSDFMCTNTVQYFIRDNKLISYVSMRSNDGWAGFRNDYQWQLKIAKGMAERLSTELGDIIWNVGSLHIYERQFYLIDHYIKTGEISISKQQYNELYGI
jgi:thymidylate synthase